MKLENIKIGESYQLKTIKKSKKALESLFCTVDVEEVINNTYTDEDEDYSLVEGQIVKVEYIDNKDSKFNVGIESEDGEVSIWTNAHCLKKIK